MIEELKLFYKKMKAYEGKVEQEEAKIAEIEEKIKPYIDEMNEIRGKIKDYKTTQNQLEDEAYQKELLSFRLADLVSNFCKLFEVDLKEISVFAKLQRAKTADSSKDLVSLIKENPEAGFIKLTIRSRKDSSKDFIYVIDFSIKKDMKFADGSSLFDNLVVKQIKGVTEICINPENAQNLVLNIHPYQTIKQQPWTTLRKDEKFHQAVLNSASKYWSRQAKKEELNRE